MWFKGLSFLSYTALLVAPTNAAFRGRDGVVHSQRDRIPARRHNVPYLRGRQQAWKNETRPSVAPQEPEPTLSEPVVVVTSDPPVTSTEIPKVETSSAVIEEPISSTAPIIEAPLPTSTSPPIVEPVPSSVATPPSKSSSVVERPVESIPVEEQPAPVTTSQAESTSDLISTSSAPVLTSTSIVPPIPESQPTTTAAPAIPSSTLIPDPVEQPSTTLPIPESTSAPLPSPSIPAPIEEPSSTLLPIPESTSAPPPSPSIPVPIEEPSSTLQPISSNVQPSTVSTIIVPKPTPVQSVIPEPQQPEPSSQQQTSSSAEQQASSTSVQKPLPIQPEPTATSITPPPVESVPIPVPSITLGLSSLLLPLPSDVVSTSDGDTRGPQPSPVSSATSLVVPSSSLVPEGPIVSVPTSNTPLSTNTLPTPVKSNGLPEVSTTSGTELLPVPSNIPSGTSSVAIPSTSLPGANIPETTALTTQPAPLPTITESTSSIGELLPPVVSGSSTATIVIPVIPTSESDSILGSTATELLPSQTGTSVLAGITPSGSIPTGITTSGSIPESETLSLPTGIPTPPTLTSDLVSTQTGISIPVVSGTELLPSLSGVSTLVSSQVSQVNPTAPIEESNTKGPVTTSASAVPSSLPSLSVSFDIFNTSPSSSVSQTDVPTPTNIPASETRSNPTTAITGLPSTLLLAPGATTRISGSTNGSDIVSSGFIGSGTSGQVPITTGQLPTQVEIKETSAAPILPIPTSESISAPSATGSGAGQSGAPNPTSDPAGPSDTLVQPSGSNTLPTGNEGFAPSPTVPAGADESKTALHPSSSTTAAAAAAPPAAPLSKSQTAGIAIGGTTCLLIALVAALFVARRYHTNAAGKRKSNGVYPEVAYLYDPPVGDRDAEAGGGVPAMSGGASGYGAMMGDAPGQGPYGAVPTNSPRHSTSGWPSDSQEPSSQNPFKDPVAVPNHALQNVARHGPTDSTVSAWPGGYQEPSSQTPFLSSAVLPKSALGKFPAHGPSDSTVSAWPAGNQDRSSQVLSPVIIPKSSFNNLPKHAPTESTVSAWPHNPKQIPEENPFLDPVAPEPQPSPRLIDHSGPVGDVMGEYVSLAINPYAFNPHAAQYPPMSPYVTAFPAQAAVRESGYSDPFSDPFEHDLLLNVDVRSETPDSIVVMAPPPTPRSPHVAGRYTPSPEPTSVSNATLLPVARVPVGGRYSPDGRFTPNNAGSNSLAPPGRYTPTPELIRSGLSTLNNSPVMGPIQIATAVPVHKGWDDIRRDDAVSVPAPLSLGPSIKKKPLPLRRQPTLAGAGQILLQGPGLPLIVKRKEVGVGMHSKDGSTGSGFGLEVPSMYGSPGPTINDFSQDLHVQRKRSGELMFADPQLLNRDF